MTHEESPEVTCHACRARFDREAWSALAVVERLAPQEVRRVLIDWPGDHGIEVRRCGRCAREIPAIRRLEEAAPPARRVAGV